MAKGAIQARKKRARAASKEAAAKEFKFYRTSKPKSPFGPRIRKPKP